MASCTLLRLPVKGLVIFCAIAGLAWGAASGQEKAVQLPRFAYPDPFPTLLAAAGKAGVPVDAKQRPSVRRPAQAGDALTFLVSLRDGDDLKQWVLFAQTADLTDKEAALPPLKGFHAYTSTGTEIDLGGHRAAIEMTLVGPVTNRQVQQGSVNPEIKRRRLLVNADYLGLGFDGACESMLAIRAAAATQPAGAAKFKPLLASKPYPEAVVSRDRTLALAMGFTPERERAFHGSVPVLLEFLNLVVKTPGLQDILREVIDVSWWSLLANGGKTKPHIRVIGAGVQTLVQAGPQNFPQYAFPFVLELNQKPAMSSILVVAPPIAPLATTGGVVGIQAGRPYDANPQLTVRLIGTSCRDPAPLPPHPDKE